MSPSPVRSVKTGSPALNLAVNVYHLLYGEDLEDLGRSGILIENGRVAEIRSEWYAEADVVGGVALPLPVNSHIHLNDYRALEHHYGLTLEQYAGFKGLKHSLITLYKEPVLAPELLNVLAQYAVIVDYQEISSLCRVYEELLGEYGVEYYGLLEYYGILRAQYWDEECLSRALTLCRGLGIGNPLRVPPHAMQYLSEISRKLTISAHVSVF